MPESAFLSHASPFELDRVIAGDCRKLILDLPDASIDMVVTSPPYWGQRTSDGNGVEDDPRSYVAAMVEIFGSLAPKLTESGTMWINVGDAYNTPINWRPEDREYSTLGHSQDGLAPDNSAYTKPRHKRRAFIDKDEAWLQYGNLLAIPFRIVAGLCDAGLLYRGEVIWRKRNPMPEGRCRRPHRHHESVYVIAKSERHAFRTSPPVPSVWEISNERIEGLKHFSRFPLELPRRCIDASSEDVKGAVVLDPFAGSGTTGVAALQLGARFLGFEIDPAQTTAANARLNEATGQHQ